MTRIWKNKTLFIFDHDYDLRVNDVVDSVAALLVVGVLDLLNNTILLTWFSSPINQTTDATMTVTTTNKFKQIKYARSIRVVRLDQ